MATRSKLTAARQSLDERFAHVPAPDRLVPPAKGWIAAIRTSLGMSYRQLAARLGVHLTAARGFELSEQNATIQLATLRRVAAALNCTLVYALVPNEPLETIARQRGREVARRQLDAVAHTMKLERQEVSPVAIERRLDGFAEEIAPRTLWDD